jgi:DNA-binding response OmpR family regulator
MTRVLVAEDEPMLLDVTTYALHKHGFRCDSVGNGRAALERWRSNKYDIVVLDINLPEMSGLDVCREIRADTPSVPIVIVSGLSQDEEIVEALEAGASDYMTKPTSFRVLAARMRNLLHRKLGADTEPMHHGLIAESGDLRVDLESCEVYRAGEHIPFTRLEARTLYFLLANAGHVVTTSRLVDLVWDYNGGDSFSLKTHISNIRRKLGIEKGEPGYISSAPHVGYRLERGKAGTTALVA